MSTPTDPSYAPQARLIPALPPCHCLQVWADTCRFDRAVVRFGKGRELARSFVIWRGARREDLVLKAERLQRVLRIWSSQTLSAALQGWTAYTQAKRREREEVGRTFTLEYSVHMHCRCTLCILCMLPAHPYCTYPAT